MAHPMETTRVYLDDHQRGVVTCPHCGDTQALNMARYPDALGGTAATCSAEPAVAASFASSLSAVAIPGSR